MSRKTRHLMIPLLALSVLMVGTGGQCNELRILTLGNCRIALDDEDNHVNPYDFGRNPAYLLGDFERSWMRFNFGYEDESGGLRRPFAPEGINDLYAEAVAVKRLGDRHVVTGSFHYGRLRHEGVYRSLEVEQYNDPFYLTDLTVGEFEYTGPLMSVDYSLRLTPKIHIGVGGDYDIYSGIKDTYTRPEIVHDYMMANLGITYEPSKSWVLGFIARPTRRQNRTEFAKADEGKDNLIHRLYGDGIYDIVATGSYIVREVLRGVELGVQNFVMTDRFALGAQLTYSTSENEIRYGSTKRLLRGHWESTVYDVQLLTRYTFEKTPLTIGLSGRYMTDDGWAKRPDFNDVILYENPVELISGGAGVSYHIRPLRLLTTLEYVGNKYDIEVSDNGANLFRKADVLQNIGRLGLEYGLFNLHSIRAGVEVTDYVIDRWLKLPGNIDRYQLTGGFRYRTGYWDVDILVSYGLSTKDSNDAERNSYSGVVWFTRGLN